MANRNPEQDLINKFVESIKKTKGVEIVCANCKLQSRADVEFKMQNGEYWVIEAKSRDSSDKYNTVHKLFGELLKETGRTRNEGMLRIGVLMPTEGKDFYIKCFSAIDKDKFIAFGELVPIAKVFLCDQIGNVTEHLWRDFHA